ncbi:MAG TPA: chromosome partitioning protein ParB, partial [Candidatus Dormibacteraeota bacterium]
LLALPASVQGALRDGRLTAGHARALLGAPTDADREELAPAIGVHGLSVRQVEHEVGRRAAIAAAAPAAAGRARTASTTTGRLSADDRLLERSLEEALGAPVTLRRRRHGGQLIVDFHDDEQLDDLYTRFGGAPL